MKSRFRVKKFEKMVIALLVALVLICAQSLMGQAVTFKNAAEAMQIAQNNRQYLFLLCYDKKSESLKAMESLVNDFRSKTAEKTLLYKAITTDEKEKDTIAKYRITRAPLPLLLVIAPNGAITGGFPREVSMDALKKSIVPNVVMEVLKSVQTGKIALVLLQNSKTKFNNESMKAAEDFSNDTQVKGYVDIIKADPGDSKNLDFVKSARISKDSTEAAVVFIIPPGSIAGVYQGKITKDTLMAALAACSSGGCGSSGGGCGPR